MAVVKHFNEIDLGMQDRTFEVICEEQVAAATDMQYRTRKFLKLDINQICHRIIFHETASLHLHSKGVHLCQILIVFRLDHNLTFKAIFHKVLYINILGLLWWGISPTNP